MNEDIKVAAVGLACLDFLALAEQAPVGGTSPMQRLLVQGGGLTATAAVAVARLGGGVRLLTRVGDDHIGRQVLDELRAEGVDVSASPVIPGATTPCSVVMVDPHTGDRTIYHLSGSELETSASAPDVEFVRASRALLVDAFWREAALAAAQAARQAGVPVVADFAPGANVEELAGLVDVFIVPESWAAARECARDCDDALRALHSYGAKIAVVTAGPRGCWYSGRGETGHCPAFEVEVVDTTGAGDVFHGAFAYALARQWDVARCVEFSAAVAALKCRELGGRTGIPDLPETLDFLRANGRLNWRTC
ncbi:MAG: ribokinase [Armatimonadota bacterium]|nr:MAG: ribokinase [Armatimonadota bacterium]